MCQQWLGVHASVGIACECTCAFFQRLSVLASSSEQLAVLLPLGIVWDRTGASSRRLAVLMLVGIEYNRSYARSQRLAVSILSRISYGSSIGSSIAMVPADAAPVPVGSGSKLC